MKKMIAVATLALLSSAAWAHDKDFAGDSDMYQSPILEHGPGSPTGEVQKGEGDLYGSHMENPEDVTPDPNFKPKPYDAEAAARKADPDGSEHSQVGNQHNH